MVGADQISQHIQGVVVAPDNNDGVFDGRQGPEQFGQDRFIFREPSR